MEMKLKATRAKRVEAKSLLLPALEGWSLWEFPPNQPPHLKQTITDLGEFAAQEKIEKMALALPVKQVFCLSLWLTTEDKALLPDLIFTQLERRGLVTRSREETVFDYRVVAAEEGKSLVFIAILPSQLPEVYIHNNMEHYDVSARFYSLEKDHLTLWREGGQLVIALTRNEELVHFQALSAEEVNPATVQEILCLYLELESQHVIQAMQGITLWENFSAEEIQLIQATFRIVPQVAEMPIPRLPSNSFVLTPHAVQQIQTLQIKEERNRKILKMALVGYGLFLGLWALQLLFFYGRVHLIKREIKKEAGLVQSLKETAARWNALGTALQPDQYAVEVLYQCARLLPQEGVRFTLFEATDANVVLRGEATSVAAASDFFEKLKQNDQLLAFQWQMPSPIILPNDTAQFQITGSRVDAPAQP